MSGAAVLAVAASSAAAPTWWAAVLDSPLAGVLIGLGASALGAWWVRRHADKAAKAAVEAESQAQYRLQARRFLGAVTELQSVLRGAPISMGGAAIDARQRDRALAALHKVKARHWDLVLDCPRELRAPADALVAEAGDLYDLRAQGVGSTGNGVSVYAYTDDAAREFGAVSRAYFTGETVSYSKAQVVAPAGERNPAGWRERGARLWRRTRRPTRERADPTGPPPGNPSPSPDVHAASAADDSSA